MNVVIISINGRLYVQCEGTGDPFFAYTESDRAYDPGWGVYHKQPWRYKLRFEGRNHDDVLLSGIIDYELRGSHEPLRPFVEAELRKLGYKISNKKEEIIWEKKSPEWRAKYRGWTRENDMWFNRNGDVRAFEYDGWVYVCPDQNGTIRKEVDTEEAAIAAALAVWPD